MTNSFLFWLDIYKTHLFICKMNLQDFDKIPDDFEKVAQAQYSVSQICAASKSQVSTQRNPQYNQWSFQFIISCFMNRFARSLSTLVRIRPRNGSSSRANSSTIWRSTMHTTRTLCRQLTRRNAPSYSIYSRSQTWTTTLRMTSVVLRTETKHNGTQYANLTTSTTTFEEEIFEF